MAIFSLHTALNLLWLGISVSAIVWFAGREAQRRASGRWLRLLAICAICITLFPSISDSDELFNFSLLQMPTQHHGGVGTTPPQEDSREKSSLHLARLLETLDHYQVASFWSICLTLACLGVSRSLRPHCLTRAVLFNAGRAPPVA